MKTLQKRIEKLAFSECKSLKEIAIPANVEELQLMVFFRCDVTDLRIAAENRPYSTVGSDPGSVIKSLILSSDERKLVTSLVGVFRLNSSGISHISTFLQVLKFSVSVALAGASLSLVSRLRPGLA